MKREPLKKLDNQNTGYTPTWTATNLPTNRPCQIYPRVSTPEQKKNVSAEMQQDKSFAIKCGWVDDGVNIILDDRDLGVSGQLRMEDREAFNTMLRRISNGEIGAVIASNVDRLFRNKWGDEPGKFMQICHDNGVVVVTPDFVYDFRISWHIDRFKRRCEEAWNYLEYHIYGRMIKAMDELSFAGYWVHGNLPAGYTVDPRKEINGIKNRRKLIIYQPHAEIIRRLFRRFKELRGYLEELFREVLAGKFDFPEFDNSVSQEIKTRYRFKKVPGGYRISDNTSLFYLLTNRVYIGHWVYKNTLVSEKNHPAIVDYDLFLYAYTQLSPVNLDNTPNQLVREKREKRVKRHYSAEIEALLKDCISSGMPGYAIHSRIVPTSKGDVYYYSFHRTGVKIGKHAKCMISSRPVDMIVLRKLVECLQNADEFDNYLNYEDDETKEQKAELKDIERDIKAVKTLIAQLEAQLKSGTLAAYPEALAITAESHKQHLQELERLNIRKNNAVLAAARGERRLSFQQLMKEVGDQWEDVVLPEDYPIMIDLFVKEVILENLTPRFFRIAIKWFNPNWGEDEAICFRNGSPSIRWTPEEDAILKEHFPTTPRSQLLPMLPTHSFRAMQHRVQRLKISPRIKKSVEPEIPYEVSWEDWQLMQQYGLTEDEAPIISDVKVVKWSRFFQNLKR